MVRKVRCGSLYFSGPDTGAGAGIVQLLPLALAIVLLGTLYCVAFVLCAVAEVVTEFTGTQMQSCLHRLGEWPKFADCSVVDGQKLPKSTLCKR